MTPDQPGQGRRREPRCPICGRPRVPRFRPFCSARCRDVDLGRWFSEAYVLPVRAPDEGDTEEPPASSEPPTGQPSRDQKS